MYKLTDSLALARSLELLDPSMTMQRAGALYAAVSNQRAGELEGVLDGLRRLLRVPTAASLPVGDAADSAATRLVFHSELAQLQEGAVFQSLIGRTTLRSSADISGYARQEFGALAAMLVVSPVWLSSNGTGDVQLTGLWTSARWSTEYQQWLDDRTAIVQGADSGALNFTDTYLRDRATLLESVVALNTKDGTVTAYNNRLPSNLSYELRWANAEGAPQLLIAENAARPGGVTNPPPRQLLHFGGAGNDTIVGTNNASGDHLYGGAGSDLLSGGDGADYLEGGADADNLYGESSNDTLLGGANADRLEGGQGNDDLRGGAGGGAGDDTYTVDTAADVVTELANEGVDWVQSSASYTLAANLENLTLTGTSAINGTGNATHNVLAGNSAANTLMGGDGNDTLDGGAGSDNLMGGAGDDTYTVDMAGDVVTELTNEGIDTVRSGVTLTLGNHVEHLVLTGSSAINATGNALNNVLTGNPANNSLNGAAGNDTLDGGAGNDTMAGGAGDDTYTVDVAGDVATELANEGIDTVSSAVAWVLGNNVENLVLTGTAAINGTGNALANLMWGNAGNNVMSGGAGVDTMWGGAGDDTYVVDIAGDVVTEQANEGTDLVQASISYTLLDHTENLTLTGTTAVNGTGNSSNKASRKNNMIKFLAALA